MDEICEVCGRISVATYGLGIPGTPIDKVCFRVKAGADTTCYVIGYERASETLAAANARAEAAEAEAEVQHARWCREVIDHCPHPTDEAVCCSDCLAAALGALAAARRAYQPICERVCGDDGEHVTACIDVRAALASPAAGEEGKR